MTGRSQPGATGAKKTQRRIPISNSILELCDADPRRQHRVLDLAGLSDSLCIIL